MNPAFEYLDAAQAILTHIRETQMEALEAYRRGYPAAQ